MKLTTNIVMTVSGLSMLLLSNHGADATLRKPRRATEDIEMISENTNEKSAAAVSLKGYTLETIKNIPGDDYLAAFIKSEECDFFTESLSDEVAGMVLDFDDDAAIIDYACNAIQRKKIVQFGEQIDGDISRHKKGSLTCKSAYEMKLSEAMPNIIELTSSYDACKEEMSTELEIVHAEFRRVLNAVSGLEADRELSTNICFGIICIIIIIVTVILHIILQAIIDAVTVDIPDPVPKYYGYH
mmetsp:Transcript_29933/g.45813  ORF Transcript_29933/g.45813 Transcript_29933/m.45813 type:complete len:242 (-) Transcript_29933:278-1003(-)